MSLKKKSEISSFLEISAIKIQNKTLHLRPLSFKEFNLFIQKIFSIIPLTENNSQNPTGWIFSLLENAIEEVIPFILDISSNTVTKEEILNAPAFEIYNLINEFIKLNHFEEIFTNFFSRLIKLKIPIT